MQITEYKGGDGQQAQVRGNEVIARQMGVAGSGTKREKRMVDRKRTTLKGPWKVEMCRREAERAGIHTTAVAIAAADVCRLNRFHYGSFCKYASQYKIINR